jgi:hypothetical protein
MKIIKVIVDELPINCSACDWWENHFYTAFNVTCGLTKRIVRDNEFSSRPDWCPLILEEDVENWLMTRPQKPKYILCNNESEE